MERTTTRDLGLVRRGRAETEAWREGRETPHGFPREGVERRLNEAAAAMVLLQLEEGEERSGGRRIEGFEVLVGFRTNFC